MKLTKALLLSFAFILTFSAKANLCDDLFTYQSGQVMNEVDESKARVISQFDLDAGSVPKGAVARQISAALKEYGDFTSVTEAINDTDDRYVTVTIAQSKSTRRLYTIIQFFMGDTEVGNVFSLYSSSKLAELGDGDCR